MEEQINTPDEIKWNRFVRINDEFVKRETLPETHPEHLYNYLIREHKVVPEDYGVFKTFQEKWMTYSKEELIGSIERLISKIELLKIENQCLINEIQELVQNIEEDGIQKS